MFLMVHNAMWHALHSLFTLYSTNPWRLDRNTNWIMFKMTAEMNVTTLRMKHGTFLHQPYLRNMSTVLGSSEKVGYNNFRYTKFLHARNWNRASRATDNALFLPLGVCLYVCECVCVCICVCGWVWVCGWVGGWVCVYVCECVCGWVYMCGWVGVGVRMGGCGCVCVCVWVYNYGMINEHWWRLE
jgi:hypothetical protein